MVQMLFICLGSWRKAVIPRAISRMLVHSTSQAGRPPPVVEALRALNSLPSCGNWGQLMPVVSYSIA